MQREISDGLNKSSSHNESSEGISKDKFFSIIAHDLKNPLNAIIGLTDLLYDEFDEYTDDEKKEVIFQVLDTSKKVYELLEKLIAWSRSQSGSLKIQKERFEIEELIDSVMDYCITSSTTKKVEIEKDIEPNIEIYADLDMVRTVLLNLITNSIKFTDKGGKIKVLVYKQDTDIRFDIIDNGVGIPEKVQPQLFEISEKKIRKGTHGEIGSGLGLILCKDFILKHEGRIWVNSKEGAGSTFSFSIPIN